MHKDLPNPAGAPGKFALTAVNAKSAPMGKTNISATMFSSHMKAAIVIHRKATVTSPAEAGQFGI
jgi:hypothetical protein